MFLSPPIYKRSPHSYVLCSPGLGGRLSGQRWPMFRIVMHEHDDSRLGWFRLEHGLQLRLFHASELPDRPGRPHIAHIGDLQPRS